jgi:hypothetical protein
MSKSKTILLFFITLFSYYFTFGQANCDELKKENDYLKNALKISSPVKTVTVEKIDFNLLTCIGNKKDQTIELTLGLVNHDVNKDFQFSELSALDVEGNEFKSDRINLGASGVRNEIYTDSPIKATILFSKVMPGTAVLRTVIVRYIGERYSGADFEFKNVSVTWK